MVKEKAYAKINLYLKVLNKRPDLFHNLEMVMASLELHDVLEFKPSISSDINVISSTKITDNTKDNLVYRVAEFLQKEFGVEQGVEIHITKNIPIAAGLAGGSADAAATFRGLNKLWKLNLSLEDMAELSLEFGSDIPFCIYNKLCIAKGRGEELAFLDKKLKMPILLVNPNIPVSTKEVFTAFEKTETKTKKISDMTNAIYNKNIDLITKELYNELETTVFEVYPEIRRLKNDLIDYGAMGVLMSGSGASVFAIDKSKKKLHQIEETLSSNYFKVITSLR